MWPPALAPPIQRRPYPVPIVARRRSARFAPCLLAALLVAWSPPSARAAVFHWTGLDPGNASWNSILNWDVGVPPNDGTADVVIAAGGLHPDPIVGAPWSILSLAFNDSQAHTLTGSTLSVGAGGISNSGAGAALISNSIQLLATQTWISIGPLTLSGPVALGAYPLDVAPSAPMSLYGVISGAGALHKLGSGLLVLGAAGTYTGGTRIDFGTLQTLGDHFIPVATLVMRGGTLDLTGNVETIGPGAVASDGLRFDFTVPGSPPTVKIGDQLAISTLGAFISYGAVNNAPATITSGPLNLATTSGTREISVIDRPSIVSEITIDSDIINTSATSGTAPALLKTGNGRLTLGGASTFSRGVEVDAGALRITSGSALGAANVSSDGTVVASGAALELLGGISVEQEPLSISSDFDGTGAMQSVDGDNHWNGPIQIVSATTVGVWSGTLHLGGIISSSGPHPQLTKLGAGTLVLEAASTYAGNTTVAAGTLRVANTSGSATSAGNVIVSAGTALAGTGNIAGQVSVSPLGTLAPGSSTGILAMGRLTLEAGAVTTMEVGGVTPGAGHDQIQVTFVANFDGELRLTLTNGFVPALGDEFVLVTYGTHLGAFHLHNLPALPPGLFWAVDYGPTSMRVRVTDTVGADALLPLRHALHAPSPNPSRASVALAYDVAEGATVAVLAYDVGGREVARPVEPAWRSPGRFVTPWEGTDRLGRPLPAGAYFLRLVVNGRPVGRSIPIQRLR